MSIVLRRLTRSVAVTAALSMPTWADSGQEGRTPVEPIWVASWGDSGQDTANIVPMVYVGGEFRPFAENESLDPEAIARQLRRLPQGRRAILLVRYGGGFWGTRGDAISKEGRPSVPAPWAERALEGIAREWPRTLALLQHCGAEVDLLVLDFEAWGCMTTWGLDPVMMDDLRQDQRWRRPFLGIEPLAESLADLEGVPSPEIKRAGPGGPYLRWNLAIGRLTARVMSEAVWKPARERYPRIVCSNYEGTRMLDRPAPDLNGHQQANDNIVGNAASPALYGELASIVNLYVDPADPTRISWSGTARIPRTPWSSFLLCQQRARACVRSAPSVPLMPWLANPEYAGDDSRNPVVGFARDLRCYDENVRHAALLGVPTFLWWRRDGRSTMPETRRLDALISDINSRTLGRIKQPADVEPISFLSEVVVSGGRRHDGKWLWRVTASPEVEALREMSTGHEWSPTAETLGFWVETTDKVAPEWGVARRRIPSTPPP